MRLFYSHVISMDVNISKEMCSSRCWESPSEQPTRASVTFLLANAMATMEKTNPRLVLAWLPGLPVFASIALLPLFLLALLRTVHRESKGARRVAGHWLNGWDQSVVSYYRCRIPQYRTLLRMTLATVGLYLPTTYPSENPVLSLRASRPRLGMASSRQKRKNSANRI
jgi:hypothetical protein